MRRSVGALVHALRIAFFCASFGACGGGAVGNEATIAEDIVGGQNDTADPAVVAVVGLGITLCSGALVGPKTVLTAGHCAFGDAAKPEIHFGPSADKPDRVVKVIAKATHPQYTTMGAPWDFGLLELETAVTDVAPLELRTAALSASDVNATMIRHVGYGVSDEATGAGVGTKRTVTYPITKVDDLIFYSGAPGKQTCNNDSGAPGLVLDSDGIERIAGVVSDGPNCHTDGWDGRADLVADFVSTTRAAWESPPPAAATKSGCAVAASARNSSPDPVALALVFFCLAALRGHHRARRARKMRASMSLKTLEIGASSTRHAS